MSVPPMTPDPDLDPVQRRLLGHIAELRDEPVAVREGFGESVVATARWQRVLVRWLAAFGGIGLAVADAVRILIGAGPPSPPPNEEGR